LLPDIRMHFCRWEEVGKASTCFLGCRRGLERGEGGKVEGQSPQGVEKELIPQRCFGVGERDGGGCIHVSEVE
jgi:hypothetical protein